MPGIDMSPGDIVILGNLGRAASYWLIPRRFSETGL